MCRLERRFSRGKGRSFRRRRFRLEVPEEGGCVSVWFGGSLEGVVAGRIDARVGPVDSTFLIFNSRFLL